jgi:hypothetical protein
MRVPLVLPVPKRNPHPQTVWRIQGKPGPQAHSHRSPRGGLLMMTAYAASGRRAGSDSAAGTVSMVDELAATGLMAGRRALTLT